MGEKDQKPVSRGWRSLLVLSLALNVGIAGLVAGFALRKDHIGPPRGVELTLGPIGNALSRDDRRSIVDDLRANPRLRPQRRAGSPDFSALVTSLTAAPFDPAEFEDAIAEATYRKERLQVAAREALTRRVVAMTDAERADFAARLGQGPKRR